MKRSCFNKNGLENVAGEMATILSRPRCVKQNVPTDFSFLERAIIPLVFLAVFGSWIDHLAPACGSNFWQIYWKQEACRPI